MANTTQQRFADICPQNPMYALCSPSTMMPSAGYILITGQQKKTSTGPQTLLTKLVPMFCPLWDKGKSHWTVAILSSKFNGFLLIILLPFVQYLSLLSFYQSSCLYLQLQHSIYQPCSINKLTIHNIVSFFNFENCGRASIQKYYC